MRKNIAAFTRCAEFWFFARLNFLRRKSFALKVGILQKYDFHEKGDFGIQKHQFGLVIYNVSWILRIPGIPDCEQVKIM